MLIFARSTPSDTLIPFGVLNQFLVMVMLLAEIPSVYVLGTPSPLGVVRVQRTS